MRIGVPRQLIVGMAALFSLYHVILGIYALGIPRSPYPILVAMGLYLVATVLSLLPGRTFRMPIWLAAFNVAVVVAVPLLVTQELDPERVGGNGYATWYVAAMGTIMTITSTRRRHLFAWIGIAFLVLQSLAWAGPASLGTLGVIGSVSWVAVSHVLSRGMAKATKDAQRFALAEREATDWQAAQEAHVFERQFRLGQTSSSALPMLRRIEESGGELNAPERLECLFLEGAIRDEIRGRKLLSDDVREAVRLARRRGATVTLLDEGGLDDLSDRELERVHTRVAAAVRSTEADTLIVRTASESSETAVTVVGLRSVSDPAADAETDGLGHEAHEDDEVDLWLEIARTENS
ncbi:hypothetical protein [Glaciihabitans arcticus]|nr:hypothetical protein [Glaciihabitans arcticus]